MGRRKVTAPARTASVEELRTTGAQRPGCTEGRGEHGVGRRVTAQWSASIGVDGFNGLADVNGTLTTTDTSPYSQT